MTSFLPILVRLATVGVGVASCAIVASDAGPGRDARYNKDTVSIMRRVLGPDSNAIDVGAFVGELTRPMIVFAPRGRHWAVEPQPVFAHRLRTEFPGVTVLELALGDAEGTVDFTLALDDPAYSGFKVQLYPRADEKTRTIRVRVARLDDVIPRDAPVAFVKIDVEGAELMVLRGARETLRRHRPVVVFEYGRTGRETFGTTPADLWTLLHDELGLELSTLGAWLAGGPAFDAAGFARMVESGREWMFVAHPAAPPR